VPETVETLTTAKNVVIVPGYGLAVSGGQYACAEMVKVCLCIQIYFVLQCNVMYNHTTMCILRAAGM
jgi:NAD/NADP transhydrogenase beta subunit